MVKKPMEHDWDSLDMTKPFTVIGVLSQAITNIVNNHSGGGSIRDARSISDIISIILAAEEKYRW